jgi:A/G-specific adenine glycosylase
MELGALICTPSSPKCGVCPVSAGCLALAGDRVSEYPKKKQRSQKREEDRCVCIIRDDDGRVLLRRRPERLLHNMWELPVEEQLLADGFAVCREQIPLGTAKHVFTHIVWHMTAYKARATIGALPEQYRWADGLKGIALPSAMKMWKDLIFDEK